MISLVAPAKINLALHVRAKRSDGYHEIETLFAFLRDGDRIEVAAAKEDSFAVTGPFAALLTGEDDNLVTRARDAFRAAFAIDQRFAIMLDKRLPVASGIGGGSADAAAALRALAQIFGREGDPRLAAIAEALGSDVPACLAGRPMLGRGRGEELTPVELPAGLSALLVNPGVPVSTAAVFAGWDGVDRGPLGSGEALAVAVSGRNDLEPPAIAIAPVIADLLAALNDAGGALLVRISGSGATCFALYDDAAARDAASRAIGQAHPDWWRFASELA